MVKKSLRNIFQTAVAVALSVSLLSPTMPSWAASAEMERTAGNKSVSETGGVEQYDSIDGLSDEILYDTSGNRVRCCGGEVHQYTEDGVTKWYWFGEEIPGTSAGSADAVPALHLYSSTDLYNWTREEDILKGMTSKEQFETDEYFKNLYGDLSDAEKDIVFEFLKNCPTAHPKMLYHASKQQYVMWMTSMNGKACITTSNSIKGPFKFVKYCEDMSSVGLMYQDSDGSAYAFYNNGGQAVVAKLTDDYMGIDGNSIQSIGSGMVSMVSEGGMFERDGKYYMVNAGTGQYAMADSLTGPWSLHSLQMCDDNGQVSQIASMNPTSCVFRVNTENGVEYINMSDKWTYAESDSERYIWLPLKFSQDGTMALRNLSNWKLDGIVPEEPVVPPEPQEYDSIDGLSGEILYDTDGERVYACGGEVHQFTENGETKWYWFGVDDLEMDVQKKHPGIHLYSSTDLYNWKHEGTMDEGGKFGFVAHPKVLYNEQQHQYVMWASAQSNGITRTIVATSNSIKGPFTVVEGAGGGISGFINLYQDSAGEAYLLSMGTGGLGLSLAKLSDDYTAIDGTPQLLEFTGNNSLYAAEGGIFERNGKYYIVNAGSPDSFGPQYAVADSLSGPWTLHKIQMWDDQKQSFENIVKKNQTSNVFHVKTDKIDTYVCVGDSVNDPTDPGVVRYIWLPIKFLENDEIALEKLSNWKLDDTIIEEPVTPPEPQEYDSIDGLSGEILYDTDGERVYACGGEVHQFTENGETKWYWFGVDDLGDGQERHPGIHLYSSTDLYNWKHEGTMDEDGQFGVVAHPKVLYNEQQHQYVMWVSTPGNGVIVATSNSIKGPFTAIEGAGDGVTGFINLYQDSAGEAYLLSADARNLSLAKLSDDYTAIVGTPEPLGFTGNNSLYAPEGGIFEQNGKYYIVNAGSPDSFGPQYAVADSLSGPWTLHKIQMWDEESQGFEDIVSKNQTSDVFHVKTDKIDTYVCVGDSVGNIDAPEVVRYIWLPIKFLENDEIALEKLSNWKFEEKEEEPPVPIEVTEVKLTETSKTLKVEEEYQINATVLPANAENRTLTYRSGDETVATVSASGKVLAKKVGNTTITVTSANGKKAELQLTVEKKGEKPPAPIEVTEIRLTERSKTLKVGDEYQITAVVLPANAEDQTLTYVSSDGTVATVSNSGKVQATKAGTTTITVTSANGTKAELQLKVEGKEEEPPAPIEVTEVQLTETSKTLKVGDEYQINATALPADAENRTLTYKSGNETVATVSASGKVLARKVGNTTITVTSANGKKAELQLKVEAVPVKTVEVQSVLVSTKKLTVGVGEKVQLEAGVYPRNASDRKLTYKPSNNKVEVSKKGRITAKKTGDCKITISASNGEKAVVKVTVKKKPGKISLNAKKKTLKAGKKFQIKPKLPKGTASYNITYVSNSKSVAVVDKNGKVTAKKKGNAVITVKTYNGKKAILKLRVK